MTCSVGLPALLHLLTDRAALDLVSARPPRLSARLSALSAICLELVSACLPIHPDSLAASSVLCLASLPALLSVLPNSVSVLLVTST